MPRCRLQRNVIKVDRLIADATGMTPPKPQNKEPERRSQDAPSDRRKSSSSVRRTGMDRRRGPGRRRGEVRRAAEEGEITGELFEFIMAIDEYKRINDRPFPSWSEVFEIIQYLGYRKVAERAEHINTASGSEVLESASGGAIDDH
ncbi:MAG: hypothetical protein IIC01_13105 [Planctomycetes bacterium]|nr:hypothetical protein [Planctomycetota bacterium]